MESIKRIVRLLMCLILPLLSAVLVCEARGPAKGGPPSTNPMSGQKQLVERLLNPNNYYKEDPPKLYEPNRVQLGVYINSFYSVNEQTMDYSINFYLRQKWTDPRLRFDPVEAGIKKVKIESEIRKIWIPDTFFRNEKKASFHDITVSNRMLRLEFTGEILYVTKISAVFSCPMQLQKYPLDTQVCPLMFESFGYTSDVMYFDWLLNDANESVAFEPGARKLPQFNVVDTIKHDCSQSYVAGNFTCSEIRFVLQRDIGFFLIQVYVPSILIVILSWVSFWINMESSPARVSIGLLTVLTTTTMSGSARATLPKVSYIKAIDVWMIVCLLFVFSSLIEYAVVNVTSRQQNRSRKPPPPPGTGPGPAGPASTGGGNHAATTEKQGVRNCSVCVCIETCRHKPAPTASPASDADIAKQKARNIDKFSRKLFPMAFMLFNVVYWTVYSLVPDSNDIAV